MIETVISVALPVDETLYIQKQRLGYTGDPAQKRICIITGIHGDELEGQYVCYEVQRRIRENPELLTGIVDIYPAINPLGIDSLTRGTPGFDLDMNRIFPGSSKGTMVDYIASKVVEDLQGADLCVDIHASNIFLREIPQIRISEDTQSQLLPYAVLMNTDFIWIHSASTVLEATLAYSMNSLQTPTIVVEMGVGMRITREYGVQLTDGIFSVMKHMGIWKGEAAEPKKPQISSDGQVSFINAATAGIFVPVAEHWAGIQKGEHIGDIIHPLHGTCTQRITAPCNGLIFTLREYPVVDEGSLIARILEKQL